MIKFAKGFIVVAAAAFLCFVFSIAFLPDFWADLTATAFDLIAAGLIFYTIWASPNKLFRTNFLLVGAAVLFWGLADLAWFMLDEVFFLDPNGNGLITAFYFGAKLSLVASTMVYVYSRLRIWDTVQLILDGITLSVAIVWLIWVLLYNKATDQLQAFVSNSIVNTLTVVLDIFLIIILGIWYLSIRRGALPAFLRLLVTSLSLFSVTDLVYYHLYASGRYVPDSFLDVCYLTALLGLAATVQLYYMKYPAEYNDPNPNTNIGHRHKGLILILFPVTILLFHTIDGTDIAVYVVLLLLHETGTSYIQRAVRNKTLLHQEIGINKKLEQLVAEQTEDLRSANEELRRRNEELNYVNLHDSLTGLHNRTYFLGKLDGAVRAARPEERVGLILWSVDSLKGINDTYGHSTGDEILLLHARRVQALLEDTGTLARFASNEFAFCMQGTFSDEAFFHVAEQIVSTCGEPMLLDAYSFVITISVGLSLYPLCAADFGRLLKNADIAMQYARSTQPDSHIAKYIDIDKAVDRRTVIGNYLKGLDYDQELQLHFQPQFRMQDKKLVGMEALLRWNSPQLGSVSPAEFIPIAEEINQIIPIGNWVLKHAVSRIAAWNRAYAGDLRMGINISPKQFDQSGTFDLLETSLRQNRAASEWIDIEITEGVALDNEDGAMKIKKYLRSRGISVSIDDFGTGYSSLGYLSIQSFDRLKIAKPLIDKITFDESHRKIVASIILLAKSLGLQTISEGVETKAQFDLLLSLGCDQLQGFYLGSPEPAEAFETKYLKPLAGGTSK